jgi:hypothetical protein
MPASEHGASLERLKATPRDLVSLTSGQTPAALARRPGPRDWSAAMVLGHLADAEVVYGFRIKMILTEDRPLLVPYDENSWVERISRLDEDVKDVLARWRLLREHHIRVLESLDESEWRRAGVHSQRGEVSIRQLASRMAEHDRGHLDQLRRALAE